jgi:hypothetical protein
MLARSRFNQVEECNVLLSKLTSSDKESVGIHTFYEIMKECLSFHYNNKMISSEYPYINQMLLFMS